MMRLLVALLLLLPPHAAAGPWLREEGSAFLSYSHTVGQDWEQSAYAEWGWTADTTLGVDIWMSDDGRKLRAVTFARRSLGSAGQWLFAGDLGLGSEVWKLPQGPQMDTIARVGLSAGRPLPDGWFVTEAQVDRYLQHSTDWEAKLTVTAGRNLTDAWTIMGQAIAETGSDIGTARSASGTAIWRLSDRLRLAATAAQDIAPTPKRELRLAIWTEF